MWQETSSRDPQGDQAQAYKNKSTPKERGESSIQGQRAERIVIRKGIRLEIDILDYPESHPEETSENRLGGGEREEDLDADISYAR